MQSISIRLGWGGDEGSALAGWASQIVSTCFALANTKEAHLKKKKTPAGSPAVGPLPLRGPPPPPIPPPPQPQAGRQWGAGLSETWTFTMYLQREEEAWRHHGKHRVRLPVNAEESQGMCEQSQLVLQHRWYFLTTKHSPKRRRDSAFCDLVSFVEMFPVWERNHFPRWCHKPQPG